MKLVLYDYWRSSASYRVRIALALKGVAYERVAVNLLAAEQLAPENRARNPQGQVPTLLVDGAPLIQSLAIIDWLDTVFPEPRLIPAEPLPRARALARALIIAADTHPIDNMRVLKRLESQFGADQAAKDEWYRHWMRLGLDALEAMAGEGRYLGGDAPGLADVVLVPQLYNARRFALDLAPYPRLVAIDAALAELPAFEAAHPDRVKPD
ncbi:MAG: maleylacetoacetate isomerase [Sphingomonas sp.]|uniref:maleylacetoacetate isomerase n=1 Tax=Sphingomonas sp. TaxID=28214 RepID=UPI0025F21350|nr:maleylacetoacetate isomerase [Sphingomonas sp.]MBX9883218.1 maleylacetoacetate isomerase [Sphingomonas sp.]